MTTFPIGPGRPAALAAALAAAALAGCAGDPQITGASVSGTVAHKGKPITGGEIRLVSVLDANKSTSGQILGDGRYTVLNAPVGEVKVLVNTEPAKFDAMALLRASPKTPPEVLEKLGPPLKYVPINKKYHRAETSDLQLNVAKGHQVHEIVVP